MGQHVIKMPDIGEGIAGRTGRWRVGGRRVAEDQIIAEAHRQGDGGDSLARRGTVLRWAFRRNHAGQRVDPAGSGRRRQRQRAKRLPQAAPLEKPAVACARAPPRLLTRPNPLRLPPKSPKPPFRNPSPESRIPPRAPRWPARGAPTRRDLGIEPPCRPPAGGDARRSRCLRRARRSGAACGRRIVWPRAAGRVIPVMGLRRRTQKMQVLAAHSDITYVEEIDDQWGLRGKLTRSGARPRQAHLPRSRRAPWCCAARLPTDERALR